MAGRGEEVVEEEEEVFFEDNGGSAEDAAFDEMVGAIENLLLDPSFVELQESFASRHCGTFEDTPENKLCYTQIFDEWQNLIESFIEKRVSEEIETFSMEAFGEMLQNREDEICGGGSASCAPLPCTYSLTPALLTPDAFDMLMTLGDFGEFKELMLDYKRRRAPVAGGGGGGATANLDACLQPRRVDNLAAVTHSQGDEILGPGGNAAAPDTPTDRKLAARMGEGLGIGGGGG
eukprot:CAMPEP_0119482232 /NCGR_PEP_ID=MMETSP1344-20130328/10183_1 /TAXON_ID=236787 /ORGANISM="Florenciella parvula, Strain CCMP2471" /LENGTH=233 /DNA_ID=CAMNT_0007516617 /DNA_START=18 /DNA_END=716 /DNA_ORIENTATION=-